MSQEMSVANKEKLVSDLKVVVADAEEILRATAGNAGEKVAELRERIGVRLRDAKERLQDLLAVLRAALQELEEASLRQVLLQQAQANDLGTLERRRQEQQDLLVLARAEVAWSLPAPN